MSSTSKQLAYRNSRQFEASMPYDTPLIPSVRVTWQEVLVLLIAGLLLCGLYFLRSGADLALPIPPYNEPNMEGRVATFASPLYRDDTSPLHRPLAKNLVKTLRYNAIGDLDGESATAESLKTARVRFAALIHKTNVLLLAATAAMAFLALKIMLSGRREATIIPATAVLFFVVSPWTSGLVFSALLTGELLGVFFIMLTLLCFSPDPIRNSRACWILAPFGWLSGGAAMACSEFAIALPLYLLATEAITKPADQSLVGRAMARLLSGYLMLVLMSLVWLGLVIPNEWHPLAILGGVDQLTRMLLLPTAAYDFFAMGRRPESLPLGILAVALLGGIMGFALWARANRFGPAIPWLVLFFLGLLGAGVPAEEGGAFFSYTFHVTSTLFLLVGVSFILYRVFDKKNAGDSNDANTRATWPAEYISAIAILGLVLAACSMLRLLPTSDALTFYQKAADAHPELPELRYRLSALLSEEAQALPESEDTTRRALATESFETLDHALRDYLVLRRDGFDGRIDIPLTEFRTQADYLARQRKFDEAIPLAEEAVRLASGTASERELTYYLARVYAANSQYKEADTAFRNALALDEDANTALRAAARAQKRGAGRTVEVYLEAIIDSELPGELDRWQLLLQLGRAKLTRGKGREAINVLEKAEKLKPDDPVIRRWLTIGYAETRQWEKVKKLVVSPEDIEAETAETDEAAPLTFYQAVTPQLQKTLDKREGDAAAMEILNEWVSLSDPGRQKAIALMNRGRFHQGQGRKLPALNDLRDAVQEDSEFAETYKALSEYYLREGFKEEAEGTLRKGYELQPKNMELLRALSAYYVNINATDQATQLLELAVDANPLPAEQRKMSLKESEPIWAPRLLLANLYGEVTLYEPAIELLNDGLKVAPENRMLLYNKALLLGKTDKYEDGAAIIVSLLEDETENPEYYLELIDIFRRNNDMESAVEVTKYAVQAIEDDPRIYVAAGEIALLGRNIQVARKSFERALALNPENKKAKEGMALIEELVKRGEAMRELQQKATAPAEQ